MNTPHRNNTYDGNGKFRETICTYTETETLDQCRKYLSKIDSELMEDKPNKKKIHKLVNKICWKLMHTF